MLHEKYPEDKKLQRVEKGIQNILNLQQNLRAYLQQHHLQQESFELHSLLQERIEMHQSIAHGISFELHVPPTKLYANKDAFIRIIDNLLSNSIKYNKQGGFVKIGLKNNILTIEDSGKGIENPSRVFERFYKEQERGIGIGLHIVKKLCDEMGIVIYVESTQGSGSCFMLDISPLVNPN
jgi:signal transduction histidine kinase